LCFRCVRVCNEGMGVGALGVVNRGAVSLIAPNEGDHLNCDECGMCVDICPVGALTSGPYRYKTRPWEMEHVGTICTHCSNGCKTTLGVRNDQIVRGNNRDRSGINGEFLCIKGRYAFDFSDHPERLQAPLMRVNGKLEPVAWSKALETVAAKFSEVKARNGKFGVIGSNHTTNEENYYLQKFARQGLGTNNIDHHRTGDVISLLDALSGRANATLATTDDLYHKKAILIIGSDLALQQPFLSFQVRANVRHHGAHVYLVSPHDAREGKYAFANVRAQAGAEFDALEQLREKLGAEPELVILFNDSVKGEAVRRLVDFGSSLGMPVQYCALLDYSNSRGAVDMRLLPDAGGLSVAEMLAANLDVLWVVGANPLKGGVTFPERERFVVVQEMFLTETAKTADVVLPAGSAYEKTGTVTNVCGQVQRLKRAIATMGTKPDLEIMGLIGKEMGLAPVLGPWVADTVFQEIRRTVHGYDVPLPIIASGGAAQTMPVNGRITIETRPEQIRSSNDNLFTSGTLGRYSKILNSVMERRQP
ncbi:MAG: molybdopterin-dependent oxidoreductase, partial [Acidobacteriota bacterium]|nr:molybdopterin-dependent oxidoreductase [Acidobacteriota bacterium]